LEIDGGCNFSYFTWVVFAHRQFEGSGTEAAAELPGSRSAQGCSLGMFAGLEIGSRSAGWRLDFRLSGAAGAVLVM